METARIGRLIDHLREAEEPVRILRWLAYSSFLSTIDLTRLRAHYAALADAAPSSGTA